MTRKSILNRLDKLEQRNEAIPEWFWPTIARCFDPDFEGTPAEAERLVDSARSLQQSGDYKDDYVSPLADD